MCTFPEFFRLYYVTKRNVNIAGRIVTCKHPVVYWEKLYSITINARGPERLFVPGGWLISVVLDEVTVALSPLQHTHACTPQMRQSLIFLVFYFLQIIIVSLRLHVCVYVYVCALKPLEKNIWIWNWWKRFYNNPCRFLFLIPFSFRRWSCVFIDH